MQWRQRKDSRPIKGGWIFLFFLCVFFFVFGLFFFLFFVFFFFFLAQRSRVTADSGGSFGFLPDRTGGSGCGGSGCSPPPVSGWALRPKIQKFAKNSRSSFAERRGHVDVTLADPNRVEKPDLDPFDPWDIDRTRSDRMQRRPNWSSLNLKKINRWSRGGVSMIWKRTKRNWWKPRPLPSLNLT